MNELIICRDRVYRYVRCKTVNTYALCCYFVSSSIVSDGIIVFLCFILYDVTGDCFILNMSQKSGRSREVERGYIFEREAKLKV